MTRACCQGEGPTRRLARRVPRSAMGTMPGIVLVLLPKCPLCLAAWLTAMTGLGVSITVATYLDRLAVVVCVAALAVWTVQLVRRRGFWPRRHIQSPIAAPEHS